MRLIIALTAAMQLCPMAWADGLQFQCGELSGIAYSPDQGWYEDKITKGETVIRLDTETGAVDMRFKDYFQIWQSVTDAGGELSPVFSQSEPLSFMLVARYPRQTIEVTTITDITPTTAKMMQSVSRMMGPLIVSRVMTADCVVSGY